MLTLQLKTTRIILINNLNNLIQQLARQSTPCRAQGISCNCHQVYKSLFLGGPLGPVGPVTLKPFTRAYVKVYNITGPTGPHVLMFYIFYCVNFIAITLIYSPSAQSYASYLLADSLKSSSGQ